jgi:hypothetical protein
VSSTIFTRIMNLKSAKRHLGLPRKGIPGKWKNEKLADTKLDSRVRDAENEGGRNH